MKAAAMAPSTVLIEIASRSAIARFDRPSATSASTLSSRTVSALSVLASLRAHQLLYYGRVDRRASSSDAPGGVDKLVGDGDALFEQIADAACT